MVVKFVTLVVTTICVPCFFCESFCLVNEASVAMTEATRSERAAVCGGGESLAAGRPHLPRTRSHPAELQDQPPPHCRRTAGRRRG